MLDRLVDAAIEALTDVPAVTLVEAVGVREIARRAGTSTRSIYHHFGDLAGLTDAVLDHVFDPGSHQGALPSSIPVQPGRTELDSALDRYRASLVHLIDDPDFALRFGLWAIGDADAQQRYAAWLLSLEKALLDDPEAIPGRDTLQPRPPITHRGLVATVVGLRHSVALRQVVDPHPDRVDHFASSVVALAASLQRQPGDSHDADSRLAEMNHFPLDRKRQPMAVDTDERTARRARVLDAAEPLLVDLGYDAVTIEAVARAAGLTPAVVHDLVGGKHALAVAVVRRRIDALPIRPVSEADALRATLLDLATVAVHARGHLLPYALDLTLDAPGVAGGPLLRRLEGLVATERARSLAVQLLQAVLSSTAASPDRVVDQLLRDEGHA